MNKREQRIEQKEA